MVNHEYTDEDLMFPPAPTRTREIKEIAMSNHGMSVVEIKRGRAPGLVEAGHLAGSAQYNRRITSTPSSSSTGPAAGDDRLRTTADPTGRSVLGTLNNCAGGIDAVGHGAVRRGELQPVLRRVR